jgi:hypothetical protein
VQPEVIEIGGHSLIRILEGGSAAYLWVSGRDKVVHVICGSWPIEDFLEVYLERLPSDLDPFEFNDAEREQWVRNEIERQFYYIDKILPRLVAETDARQLDSLAENCMNRLEQVVDIRARYFGGPSAAAWSNEIVARALRERPDHPGKIVFGPAEIEARKDELKQWWAEHRDDPITLPTVAAAHPSIATPTTRPREVASEERATVTQPRSARAPGPASTGLSAPTRAVPRPGRLPTEPDEEATAPRPVLVFLAAGAIVLVATWIWWRRSRR